jgi:hypothetical protein
MGRFSAPNVDGHVDGEKTTSLVFFAFTRQ